jgi:amidase
MVPVATGTDGGGSLRIPAACCGLVAMKPSRGRVSSRPLGSTWLGMACYGALARTVADSALLLDVVAGTTAEDPYRLPTPNVSFAEAVRSGPSRPLRVAISTALPLGEYARLSGEQRLAFERTARLLAELGHEVEPRDPAYGLVSLEYMAALLGGAHDDLGKLSDPRLTERATRQTVAVGRFVTQRVRRRLFARRPRTTARITALWDEFDVLLTPGLARTALAAEGGYGHSALHGLWIASQFMPYYPVFNLTGQPAISLPAGLGADGLPLSIQLVGRVGDEATLYALASEIEAARPWAFDRPHLATL